MPAPAGLTAEIVLPYLRGKESNLAIATSLNVTARTVGWWRARLAMPSQRMAHRLYSIDHTFFADLKTEQQAYVLGFICADGYVPRSGKWICIAIKDDDMELLVSIRACLNSNAPIRTRTTTTGYAPGGRLAVLHLSSKQLVRDAARFGVVPNKSHTLTYPDIPEGLHRHYIRGLFDGDGHIGPRQVFLGGTLALLTGVRDIIIQMTGCTMMIGQNNNHSRLVGCRRDRKALAWLYEGASIGLVRKRDSYIKHWG